MGYSPYSLTIIDSVGFKPKLRREFPYVGVEVEKDMTNAIYTTEFNPATYQSELFSDMADFISDNIVAGDKVTDDRLIASFWDDLGNDVFDDWGFFYIYDVTSERYYFPLIAPQN
jgi:hypothetical protein